MSDDKFDVVFKGELVRSFEPSVVKKNIGQLFKIGGEKLDALFSGKIIVLKRNLDFDSATKYRVAIKKAGARVDLVPVEPIVDTSAAISSERKVVLAQSGEGVGQALQNAAYSEGSESEDEYTMTIAPAGSDILKASEREEVIVNEIDISSITLKQGGGDLLNTEEKRLIEPLDVDLDSFALAEAGEDLLTAQERKTVVAPQIDTSELSIAEPGERLSEPSPEPPPAPDVSGMTLEP